METQQVSQVVGRFLSEASLSPEDSVLARCLNISYFAWIWSFEVLVRGWDTLMQFPHKASVILCRVPLDGCQDSSVSFRRDCSYVLCQQVSSAPVCFFLGGGRGEAYEAEVDAPPSAVLPQPPPASSATPVLHVQPLASAVAPSLFQASTQPEVLLPKPAPVYSDSVGTLHV